MAAHRNYRVLSCEGGDQVGKGDAIQTFSKRIYLDNIHFTLCSFPAYDTPFGNTIRFLLKGGGDNLGLSVEEELRIKMAFFALNRLEFLNTILQNPKYSKNLLLFDRSSFSNALTIAYAIAKSPEDFQGSYEEIVDLALELDSLFIDKLNLKNCVVQLVHENEEWRNTRGHEDDLHESTKVQEISREIYGIYAKKVGLGWKEVVTKEGGVWNSREKIFNEINSFATERLGQFKKEEKRRKYQIGIREIAKDMYLGAEVDRSLVNDFRKSLLKNDKEKLYSLSSLIRESVCDSCDEVVFGSEEVRRKFKKIIRMFPLVVDVLEYNAGKSFADKVLKGLEYE